MLEMFILTIIWVLIPNKYLFIPTIILNTFHFEIPTVIQWTIKLRKHKESRKFGQNLLVHDLESSYHQKNFIFHIQSVFISIIDYQLPYYFQIHYHLLRCTYIFISCLCMKCDNKMLMVWNLTQRLLENT